MEGAIAQGLVRGWFEWEERLIIGLSDEQIVAIEQASHARSETESPAVDPAAALLEDPEDASPD